MGGININIGGGSSSGKRRLLVWNLVGSITLREEHATAYLDIEFAEV